MDAINYSNFRKNLKTYCDKVCETGSAYIVTRKADQSNIVVLSIDEYNNLIKAKEEATEILKKFLKHKTLEEYAASFDGNLNLDGEFDWGERN